MILACLVFKTAQQLEFILFILDPHCGNISR